MIYIYTKEVDFYVKYNQETNLIKIILRITISILTKDKRIKTKIKKKTTSPIRNRKRGF